ncbi:hypothetical protein TRIUR3_16734 [Triticum urartu]|uniref:Serine aminopeptidase S33 domain-containing protein n=1 Tax=Triticum urartu TaxID=4572 RepID=M7ZM81_TRIUA|nr:hypothetical protein TRIUR3_16734 [Triticum urartu]
MIEQFVNFVIRPPRAEYNPDQYLWEPEFTLAGRKYKRIDLEAMGAEQMQTKLLSYFCLQTLHFLHLISLDQGYQGERYNYQKQDLKSVVSFLRKNKEVSCIGLWGRSMGAVTSLLYGAEDPSIAGMVLDSAFSNLYELMLELVDVYKIRVPKFTVKMAVHYMRRVIQRRAKFDIMDLNVVQFAPKTFIPALFGHASSDVFIQSHHTDRIHQAYAGDKNLIKFDGDHNSARPQFYYDSVSIFFYNVLNPPQFPSACSNKLEKYYNRGAGTNESLLYEIINGLRAAGTDAGSSSAAAASFTNATKSVVELLTERVNQLSVKNDSDLDFLLDENHNLTEMEENTAESHTQDKANRQNEECCSYTSSNRESWGRCSSLGAASDVSSSGERPRVSDHKHKMSSVDSSFVDDSSSDEEFDFHEEEEIAMLVAMHKRKKPKHDGSVYGRAFIRRERIDAHKRLVRNYFASSPVFPENYFRRRFRMSKDLFFRICNEVKQHNPVFEQRRNCAGLLGHSIKQKVTSALRIMAYGVPADYIDDNLAMAESTSIFYVKQFAITMVEVFGPQYLRAPNAQDTQRLLEMNKARGFPANGEAPSVTFEANGRTYNYGYYLADGIYPRWSTFVKPVATPQVAEQQPRGC